MKYTIQKGQQDWKPREPFRVLTGFDAMTWIVTPDESMKFDYIDPATGELDADWADWKKIGGISLANWRNPWNLFIKNRDAVMLAWRWNPTISVFEFAVYVNDAGGRTVYERADQVLRVGPGEKVALQITRNNRRSYNATLYLVKDGSNSANSFTIDSRARFNWYSLIGLWYGGSDNAAGPWGGRAPKDMEIDVEFIFS